MAAGVTGIVACVGVPEFVAAASGAAGSGGAIPAATGLYNAAAVLADGRVAALYRKHHLPNYAVFDERRYFMPGGESLVIDLDGRRVGVTICEDIWMPGGPAEWAAVNGDAEIVVNLSASPYHQGKGRGAGGAVRSPLRAITAASWPSATPWAGRTSWSSTATVSSSDRTGRYWPAADRSRRTCSSRTSTRPSPAGSGSRTRAGTGYRPLQRPPQPDRAPGPDPGRVSVVRLRQAPPRRRPLAPRETMEALSPEAEIYGALTLGTADYIRKNGFPGAVLGLSGGIDSALALTIAADAIGPEAVTAVSMPSRYTAGMNRDDAAILARRLGVQASWSCRSRTWRPPTARRWPSRSPARDTRTSPKRTCRPAYAATC